MNPEPDQNEPAGGRAPEPPPLSSQPPELPPALPPPLPFRPETLLKADVAAMSVNSPSVSLENDEEIVWPPPPRSDRWAHRRGEPRLFTLYWIAWLMLNSSMVLIRLGPRGLIDPAVSRPATRTLFMLLAVGATVLWPMFRLSQALPQKKPLGGVLLDVLIMYSTAQIVLWPQVLLAYWPTHVIMGTSLSLLAWLLITASVLSFAMEKERRYELEEAGRPIAARRAKWMALCLAVSVGGAILPAIFGWTDIAQRPDPDLWMLASGVTSPFELTRDRFWAGSSARLEPKHWTMIWSMLGAGGVGVLAVLIHQCLPYGKPRSGGIS